MTRSKALLPALLLAIFTTSCAHKPTAPAKAEEPLLVIDVHTHTDFSDRPDRESGVDDSKAGYLASLRRAGIVGSVSLMSRHHTGYHEDLARDQNVVFCQGIGDKNDWNEIEAGLKSKKYRCLKIYLGYIHRFAYDKFYEPAYKLAEKYSVPVVFHTGDTYSIHGKLKYSEPLTIDEVAVDHPKVKFVIAHLGNPWIQAAAEVAYKNPNVYVEGSALLIGDLKAATPEKVDEYLVKPLAWAFGYLEDPKKLMFGTDWPLVDHAAYLEAYKRAIPREHWNAVFYDNAAEIFGFAKRETLTRKN